MKRPRLFTKKNAGEVNNRLLETTENRLFKTLLSSFTEGHLTRDDFKEAAPVLSFIDKQIGNSKSNLCNILTELDSKEGSELIRIDIAIKNYVDKNKDNLKKMRILLKPFGFSDLTINPINGTNLVNIITESFGLSHKAAINIVEQVDEYSSFHIGLRLHNTGNLVLLITNTITNKIQPFIITDNTRQTAINLKSIAQYKDRIEDAFMNDSIDDDSGYDLA